MVKEKEGQALARLAGALERAAGKRQGGYVLPGRWLDPERGGLEEVDPAAAYGKVLASILGRQPQSFTPAAGHSAGWTGRAVVYNLFPRLAAAWDHDGDGRVGTGLLPGGWRETGTLVKSLAFLPYIRSLGCNTVHLLPVAAIGADGAKGDLGSPYAVRNPYRVDERLAEPALGLTGEQCLAAFVAAAHHLGMRVVAEFVFRTASPDSDWVQERPDWFYWVDARVADRPAGSTDPALYGPPVFTAADLAEIHRLVDEEQDLSALPAPPAAWRGMFGPAPEREAIFKEGDRWVGVNAEGRRLRVATAFADWPPDDCQPPWTDVAYLKLYQDRDYDYPAYNTVRMYDRRLARPEKATAELWDRIVGILPWWQEQFGIDGVMIDMGHSLPAELKDRIIAAARAGDRDFAFWDEKFPVDEESLREGYNAVIGYSWMATCRADELEKLLGRCCGEGYPLPFFATAESHNSPRAAAREGGVAHSRGVLPFLCALPAMAWIHNGYELGDREPVNTGLDFTPDQVAAYAPGDLPLFSRGRLDWLGEGELIAWVRRCLALRERFIDLILAPGPEKVRLWRGGSDRVLVFLRQVEGRGFVLIGNIDWAEPRPFEVELPGVSGHRTCFLTDRALTIDAGGRLAGDLAPGETLWVDLEEAKS